MELGFLPADVLGYVMQLSSPQAAHSVYATCRHWHDRFKNLFATDRVVISARICEYAVQFRLIFEMHRGRVKEYTMDHVQDFNGSACRPIRRVAIGHFDSMRESTQFIENISRILSSNEELPPIDAKPSDVFECSVELGPKSSSTSYYTVEGVHHNKVIEATKGMEIVKLLSKANFVTRSFDPKNKPSLKIKIDLKRYDDDHDYEWLYRNTLRVSDQGDVFVFVEGVSKRGDRPESYSIKTSPDFYHQLVELIQYSKHKTNLLQPCNIDARKVQYFFRAKLKTSSGTTYHVQEYSLFNEPKVVTNGYKTNTVKKIVQLLVAHLYPAKFEANPTITTDKAYLPKPTSNIFELVRRAPYQLLVTRCLRVDSVNIGISWSGKSRQINLSLRGHSPIPRNEVLDLFEQIEPQLTHSKAHASQYRLDKHVKGETVVIMSVSFNTFYSCKLLNAKLNKQTVDRLLNFLAKWGCLDEVGK